MGLQGLRLSHRLEFATRSCSAIDWQLAVGLGGLAKLHAHEIAFRPNQPTVSGRAKIVERQQEASRQRIEPVECNLSAFARQIESSTLQHSPACSKEYASPGRNI
jgi:hypothetical protein